MFLAIAFAAPRRGRTVSSAASSWLFAGVVDPAAGLPSLRASAGREPVDPFDEADDDAGRVADPALPFAEGAEDADDAVDEDPDDDVALLPFAGPDGVDDAVDDCPEAAADPAVAVDAEPPAPDVPEPVLADAAVDPAAFSPSSGA
jgi:hypothetical protein